MGCCQSLFLKVSISEDKINQQQPQQQQQQQLLRRNHGQQHHVQNSHFIQPTNGTETTGGGVPSFTEFSFADLKAATNNFSAEFIVSESGEKAPNVVYKGRLQQNQNSNSNNNRSWIAVKKFTKLAWPDPKQFAVNYLTPSYCYFFLIFLNFLIFLWFL